MTSDPKRFESDEVVNLNADNLDADQLDQEALDDVAGGSCGTFSCGTNSAQPSLRPDDGGTTT